MLLLFSSLLPLRAPFVLGLGAALGLGVALALLAPSVALAQETPALRNVEFQLNQCTERQSRYRGLMRQLEIELRGAGIEIRETVAPDSSSARLFVLEPECHPGPELLILVQRAAGGRTLSRPLPPPESQSRSHLRVVALAAVEVLREAWVELAQPAPQPATDGALRELRAEMNAALTQRDREIASLRERVREGERERERALREERAAREAAIAAATPSEEPLGWGPRLAFATLAYLGSGTALTGPSLGIDLPLLGPLRLDVDAAAAFGGVEDPLGRVELQLWRGQVSLLALLRHGPLALSVGAWAGVGLSRAEGLPSAEASAEGAVGGALEAPTGSVGLSGGARALFLPELTGEVRVGGGYGFGGFEARSGQGARLATTYGPTFSLLIGLRYHPG